MDTDNKDIILGQFQQRGRKWPMTDPPYLGSISDGMYVDYEGLFLTYTKIFANIYKYIPFVQMYIRNIMV